MSLKTSVEIIREHIKQMPNSAGVYRFLDETGTPLYIGKAKSLPKRVASYTRPEALPYRLQVMISLTKSMKFDLCKSEAQALLLESSLVGELQPRYNILLKDGKSFPYILLTGDKEYNMMMKFRGKQVRKGQYFGPFVSAGIVMETLIQLQKAFPLRTCTDATLESRTRPCLEYQIKRCTAPCVAKISKEDYKEIENQLSKFLSGKTSDVQSELSKLMQEASEKMDFERAATMRDRIYALSRVQSESRMNMSSDTNLDAISFYIESGKICVEVTFIRNGFNYGNNSYFPTYHEGIEESELPQEFLMQFYQSNPVPKTIILNVPLADKEIIEEALGIKCGHKVEIELPQKGDKLALLKTGERNAQEALARRMAENATQKKLLKLFCEEFKLEAQPERIEVYDNSHISGTNSVGAMIVINEQGMDKKSYRKFNIKTAAGDDDFAMMREVLARRFARSKTEGWVLPDVVLIDGGAGQFSSVKQVMDDMGVSTVTLIAIAKGPDRNAGNEVYHMVDREPFQLRKGSELAYFMQRIRDEAHRFAITTHRAKRAKDFVKSGLDEISGVGAVRKKALLHHFGSVGAIKEANVKDLQAVEGINAKTAEIVYNFFH